MNKIIRSWIVLGVIAILAGFAVYEQLELRKPEQSAAETSAPQPGKPAPSFRLASLEGQSFSVGGERDKPLLLNFWASWCGPCAQEAPELKAVYEKLHDRLDVYAVNVTTQDEAAKAQEAAQKFGFTFPVLLDEKGDAIGAFKVRAIPTTFLIDRKGNIVEALHFAEPGQLESKLASYLASAK